MAAVPYNVSLSSQTPTIAYAPMRDGPLNQGWNITYTGPIIAFPGMVIKTAGGSSSHRTSLTGANFTVRFTGTAAYLLGDAPQGAYTVAVDGGKPSPGAPDSAHGMLAVVKGLMYGEHTVVVTVVQPVLVSFGGAVLTIGLHTAPPAVRNIDAVLMDGHIRPNPTFDFQAPGGKSWQQGAPRHTYNGTTPMTLTPAMNTPGGKSSEGSTCTFTLNNASAFFIHGSMIPGARNDRFSVSLTPSPSSSPSQSGLLGLESSWDDPNEVLYWNSGLDRDTPYKVVIKSEVSGPDSMFGFRSVEVWDAGSGKVKATLKSGAGRAYGGGMGMNPMGMWLVVLVWVIMKLSR